MRHEAAIDTPLGFSASGPGSFERLPMLAIEFNELRFIWHDGREGADRQYWPIVSVEAAGGEGQAAAKINRFLSALCFIYDVPMLVASAAGTGFKKELDPPLIAQPGYGVRVLMPPVSAIAVAVDERLRLTLALNREGQSATSPFYRYLALYNALEAAFDNHEQERDEFMRTNLAAVVPPSSSDRSSFDWADYLRDSLRNAVAHAVRRTGKPVLDPDESADRSALHQAAEHIAGLIRLRVQERWPDGVQSR